MPFEPGDGRRSVSPLSTGRSSPALRAPRRVEDGVAQKDKTTRRYATAIERALSSFDSAQQEWADYIAFLARLLKALNPPPPNLEYLPHAQGVALRLAQCLNPALPSGVHQKALDVYANIFSFIPPPSLGQTLHVYLPGLVPVLSFASLSVRPIFYSVIEDHILKLDSEHIRPATKSLILSLLPGIEDETSEDFDRAFRILDVLRKSSARDMEDDPDSEGKDGYFWQCFFLAVITNPSRRQGALAFLTRKLPNFAPSKIEDRSLPLPAQAAINPEPGLLVRCFAAGLQDSQILVQRGFLDLLVTHLPLHSPVFRNHVRSKDMVLITTAAAGCVLRRDMSLNRRLWSWFLGPDPTASEAEDGAPLSPTDSRGNVSQKQAMYFQKHGAAALEKSIMNMLGQQSTNPATRARPFRVCLSLMDRWEVGGLIVPKVLLPALRSAYEYSQVGSLAQLEEVIRSASLFFDGVESSLIWSRLISVLLSSFDTRSSAPAQSIGDLEFLHFVIDRFDVRDEEMLLRHIPNTLLILLARLASILRENKDEPERFMILVLSLAQRLLRVSPPRAFEHDNNDGHPKSSWQSDRCHVVVNSLIQQYTKEDFDESTMDNLHLDRRSTAEYMLQSIVEVLRLALTSSTLANQLGLITDCFVSIITKTPSSEALRNANIHDTFKHALDKESLLQDSSTEQSSFLVINSIMSVIIASVGGQQSQYFTPEQIMDLQTNVLNGIWHHLSPFRPKYHVEAVRLIWQLESLTKSEHQVEARLALLVGGESEEDGPEVASRFTVLWEHTMQSFSPRSEGSGRPMSRRPSVMPTSGEFGSDVDPEKVLTRPLLLLLDSLNAEGTGAADVVLSWLQSLSSLDRVFYIICSKLHNDMNNYAYEAGKTEARHRTRRNAVQHLDGILFCLKHLRNLLRRPNEHLWLTLSNLQFGFSGSPRGETPKTDAIEFIAKMCLRTLALQGHTVPQSLQHAALTILQTLLECPNAFILKQLEIDDALIGTLSKALKGPIGALQTVYLETISKALKLRATAAHSTFAMPRSPLASHRPSLTIEVPEKAPQPVISTPPPELLSCLRTGLSSPSSRLFLEHWVEFLDQVLPLYADAVFANLLPLVECICKQVSIAFRYVKHISHSTHEQIESVPISTLSALLHGLELVLAHVHRQFQSEEIVSPVPKSPEPSQGFFGNISGVFAQDGQQAPPSKTSRINSRLTMILSFQDAIRICFSIWAWASNESGRSDTTCAATISLNALKLRNRTRKILENLFAAEELECLETLALIWSRSKPSQEAESAAVFSLLLVLDGSRPKNTVPVIINALYSRTNIDALDIGRRSSLTSDLSTAEVAAFLLSYSRAIEDDATDEIWTECTIFLRDVLSNPLPHRQILPSLLEFTVLLAEKIDNTNFGELRKMRRELGDIFLRLLTATFTARPLTNILETPTAGSQLPSGASDLIHSLLYATPKLTTILQSNDRVQTAVNTISNNVMTPAFHAKAFPENVNKDLLKLFEYVAQQGPSSKHWKKDISDAFNNPRLLTCSADLMQDGWYPVLRKWALSDKDRLPELLSKITAPSTAGIMFGVGANAARLEADRRTQLTLRKAMLLMLSCEQDTFVGNLTQILDKVVDLCAADPSSSPSSTTRADVFMLLRAMILSFSPIHLSAIWPVLNANLQKAITTCLPGGQDQETYSNLSLLQACKLLDLLTTLTPDEFQLHEWLYITDTIDAVYRPVDLNPVALTDEAAEALGMDSSDHTTFTPSTAPTTANETGVRRPFLGGSVMDGADMKAMAKDDFLRGVLQPFFSQLSMFAYEATYSMGVPDVEICRRGLLEDVLDESTMA
ncbi:hypothetical protein M438DRAFT_277139 [Aureobasidium pullulans EXF-150]|uniref:Uncharacterized protein n=1 Tax=Aureobasidium pullulans EXF-150 TaxID=1043002 RepID=A0A074Y7C5_AURPU|nr:uncharacterized protein M438DRAFT_277139 [Aureobasidium pullulans EXF-150]KEQ82791.1 hypothetical protein M438DRAFT_277139 [Aureobasidium pullulans EXF-150]